MEILMDYFWIALPPKQGTVDGADSRKKKNSWDDQSIIIHGDF